MYKKKELNTFDLKNTIPHLSIEIKQRIYRPPIKYILEYTD